MTKKLLVAAIVITAISLFVFYSIDAKAADSGKGIQLSSGMTFTDPGKNAVFTITSIDSNIIKMGIRIDGSSNVVLCSCSFPGFQTFVNEVKSTSIATPSSPLAKKLKAKSYYTAPIVSGNVWKSKAADVTITIQSQNGGSVMFGIRIDGSSILSCSTNARDLNAMLSEPGKFQLVVAKAQESSSY